jgi:hypothetical protein
MASLEVTLYGQFWVTPEALNEVSRFCHIPRLSTSVDDQSISRLGIFIAKFRRLGRFKGFALYMSRPDIAQKSRRIYEFKLTGWRQVGGLFLAQPVIRIVAK